jgi:hypothetical protein
MVRACSTNGEKGFWLGDPDVGGGIILKWILEE